MRLFVYIGLTFFVTWVLITFWGPTGLPFWPIMLSAAALLALWGLWAGKWIAPVAVLSAYVMMRGVFTYVDIALREHYAFFVWVIVGLIIFFGAKRYITAGACFGAGAVYAASAFIEMQITRLAPNAILAEMFAILALISIGGGLYGGHSRFVSFVGPRIRDPLAGFAHWLGKN